jgi:hypothetical protein
MYCGACGSNAQEYEMVIKHLNGLRQLKNQKRFEELVQNADHSFRFQPKGPSGRQLLEEIRNLKHDADMSIQRREFLKEAIALESRQEHYESVEMHINEYHTLTDDASFMKLRNDLPGLMLKRDLRRAKEALDDHDLDYAERICKGILSSHESNKDADKILNLIHKIRGRQRLILASAWCVIFFFVYVFSVAPVFQLTKPSEDGLFRTVYGPVYKLHDGTVFRGPLEAYAKLWGAPGMFGESAD